MSKKKRTVGDLSNKNRFTRREFLQWAGVSAGAAAMGTCGTPKQRKVKESAANRFVLGVSTSIFPGLSVSESDYALLERYGIVSVEIGYEQAGPALMDRTLRGKLVALVRNAHPAVFSLHAPYKPNRDLSALDEESRLDAVSHTEEALELASQVGAGLVTIHCSQGDILEDERADRLSQSHKSLSILAETAKRLNLRLAVETMPPDFLPVSAAEAFYLVEGLDSEVVGFCLDTNHSNLTNDLRDVVRALGSRIWNVHLSDNDGREQRHWMPFKGVIDWKSFLAILMEVGYKGPLHYELDPHPGGPEQCLKGIQENFNRLSAMMPSGIQSPVVQDQAMDVSLFFDVEDCITPESDDIVKDLAEILSANGLVGEFLVVGDKARILENRGRQDVINALKQHEIGLHTDRHSRHPTVAEYLEDKRWDDGIEEVVRRERPGVETIRRIFGESPACWGQSGGSWGPQVHPAMKRLDVPVVVYPETYTPSTDIHWYGGVLTLGYRRSFGGFDQKYSDDVAFLKHFHAFQSRVDEYLEEGYRWMCVFCGHPITVRAYEFGDAINFAYGRDVPPDSWEQPPLKTEAEYRAALKNFAVLVKYIASHPRLRVVPVSTLEKRYGRAADRIGQTELLEYAKTASCLDDIPVDDARLSPAEAVFVQVQAILALNKGKRPGEYSIQHVDGPGTMPPEIASSIPVDWETFIKSCESVESFIDRFGQLPASVNISGTAVGIGSFYFAVSESFAFLATQNMPRQVVFRSGPQIPSIAEKIAELTAGGYHGWIIHKKDLNTANLLELTRLQTWTLKPAFE